MDKTQRVLRQLLVVKSGARSEQISADQLWLFARELGIVPAIEERNQGGDDQNPAPPSPPATGVLGVHTFPYRS